MQVLHAELVQTTCCDSATAQSGRPMTSAAHAAMFGETESSETGIKAGSGVVAGLSPWSAPKTQRAHAIFAATAASQPAAEPPRHAVWSVVSCASEQRPQPVDGAVP